MLLLSWRCGLYAVMGLAASYAGVAQLVEHGIRNAVVAGSTPAVSSKISVYCFLESTNVIWFGDKYGPLAQQRRASRS